MKKVLAVVLLIALMVSMASVVSACFGDELTVTFYHTMGANGKTVLDKYIAEFQKIYPNINIEHETSGGWGDIENNVLREVSNGEGPTMAYCYSDHVANYAAIGSVENMQTYISSTDVVPAGTFGNETDMPIGLTQAEIDDFIDRFYAEGQIYGEGLMYTLPFSKSTEVMYYNKTTFDALGLLPPTHWWCGEGICENGDPSTCKLSVYKVCEIIKAELDPQSRVFGYDSDDNLFITLCEQMGIDYTDATAKQPNTLYTFYNDQAVEMLVKLNEMYQEKGYLVTKMTNSNKYTSDLFTNPDKGANKTYMCVGSTGGGYNQRPEKVDGEYAFEVGIAPIPQVNPSNPKVISQGPSVVMFNHGSEEQRLATWLFIKYLTTNRDFQTEFAMAHGYTPVLESVRDESLAEYDQNDKPLNQMAVFQDFLKTADGGDGIAALACITCLEQEEYYFVSPAFPGSSIARTQVGNALAGALYCSRNDEKGNPLTAAQLFANIKSLLEAAWDKCEDTYKTPKK